MLETECMPLRLRLRVGSLNRAGLVCGGPAKPVGSLLSFVFLNSRVLPHTFRVCPASAGVEGSHGEISMSLNSVPRVRGG